MNFNALIEFIILAGGSFFIFMFLAYRDAIRTKKPKGPLASLLNNFKGWEYEDENGVKGILFRQPFWIKLLIALISALLIRIVFDIFFDFKSTSGNWGILTGYTGWLLMSVVIYFGMFMSYLWPNVKSKIVTIKDDTLKKGNEAIENSKAGLEKIHEEAVSKKDQIVEEVKEVKEKIVEPKETPKPKKKDDPDDIINEYLG